MALPRVQQTDLHGAFVAIPEADWRRLAGKHLFIAGGTGFLGCWLLEALLHANDRLGLGLRLSVLSRQPRAFEAKAPELAAHAAVRLVEGDIRHPIQGLERFDLLIHAAADVENADADPVHAFDAIVDATRGALDLARRGGARRLLHVSSGAVYGTQPSGVERIGEDHPSSPDAGDPRAAYALGKRVSEWLCDQAARTDGIEVVHARVFALVGPYLPLNAHFAAGNFLADAAAGRAIRVTGNGAPLRSYLYGADAAVWLVTLLLRGTAGTAYNVGSEEAISILDLARRIAAQAGVPVLVADDRPVSGPPPRYVPDTRRARDALGLVQYTGLHAALERSLDWARQLQVPAASPASVPHQATR